MARTRYKIYENERPYFLTSTVVNWLPVFGSVPIAEILLNSLKFLQENNRLTIYAYVIMENHIHLIASSVDLSKEIGDFKPFTAVQIIKFLKEKHATHILEQLKLHKLAHKKDRTYQFWQEGNHPQQIQSEKMMRQKIEYIHYNPVKRGWVDDPTHWRYSSARNYAGQEGLLEVCKDWL